MPATAHSETGALRSVVLKQPRDAFGSEAKIAAEWRRLRHAGAPDLGRAIDEHERFAELLRAAGAEIVYAPADPTTTLDSIYVRDAALITDGGAILCAMGKVDRRSEPAALRATLEAGGVAVAGAIGGDGRLEGGDTMWLPGNILAVGRGYRSNAEGIRQLRELAAGAVEKIEIVEVPLPHWRGPGDVFHLMSMISPVAADAVLVYSPLLPVPFREWLLSRGLRLIEVPDEEYETMAANVLALAPGRCLMLDGNPTTRRRLEDAGVEVTVFSGAEICRKGAGGPTCLARPLLREA
jgi:N-dimethylarginine dimethylaminohydrolase